MCGCASSIYALIHVCLSIYSYMYAYMYDMHAFTLVGDAHSCACTYCATPQKIYVHKYIYIYIYRYTLIYQY